MEQVKEPEGVGPGTSSAHYTTSLCFVGIKWHQVVFVFSFMGVTI